MLMTARETVVLVSAANAAADPTMAYTPGVIHWNGD